MGAQIVLNTPLLLELSHLSLPLHLHGLKVVHAPELHHREDRHGRAREREEVGPVLIPHLFQLQQPGNRQERAVDAPEDDEER